MAVGRFAREWGKCSSLLFVLAVYVVAGAAGGGVAYAIQPMVDGVKWYALLLAAVADLVATIVVWLSAIVVDNSSMYDPYWSVFTPLVFWYWALWSVGAQDRDVPTGRLILCFLSAWVWAIRLTVNWMRDWPGLHHVDWRYTKIYETITGSGLPKAAYWLVGSLGGIMLFPTLQVFLGTIPLFFATTEGVNSNGANDLNWLDFVAAIVCVGAAIVQYVADEQMRNFRKQRHPKGTCMESGLWRYSRHPNYFGELSFWCGMYLHALATNAKEYYWTGIGFVAMVGMFVFASIPLMEKRSLKSRPNFAKTMATTSMLIPLPRWPEPSEDSAVGPVTNA